MDANTKQQLMEYRKKHFAVEVRCAEHSMFEGEVALSITTNGYQWQTITLSPDEKRKVIKALRDFKTPPPRHEDEHQ